MRSFTAIVVLAAFLCSGCLTADPPAKQRVARDRGTGEAALLDDVERRSFHYFWDLADPNPHLIPDRAPTPSSSSIAAGGFGLTPDGISHERGSVTRTPASQR